MRPKHLLSALVTGLFVVVSAFSQGSLVIHDPSAPDAPNAVDSDKKYKLSAAEQSAMDKYILPKVRAKLAGGACEETVEIAGRHAGSFTKPGSEQTMIFYQYCQTGNGLGSAGLVILEKGKPVASFIAPDAGWTIDSAILPDVNQNGLDEIALYYSGGMHQGEGGTGVDIVEYSAGKLKGVGWFQADGFTDSGPVFGFKVTADPGKTPSFFREKYLQNAAGKWRKTGKVLPLKLGEIVGRFEAL